MALSTAILKTPTGKYILVGSVPYELTKPVEKALTPGLRNSIVWNTEDEAIQALLNIGITNFQLSNTKFYKENEPCQ